MEVIVSIGIIGILSVAVTTFSRDIFVLNRNISSDMQIIQSVQSTLQKLTSELRSASLSNTGTFPILEASSTAVTFYSDSNYDGIKEQIRYYLVSDILYRSEIHPVGNPLTYTASSSVSVALTNISSGVTLFDYFDSDYAGTSSPLTQPVDPQYVRLIKITLPVGTEVFTTQVVIRNLKDNL